VGLYQRDPSYDPKTDGIVRTQARRVRERLDEYYRAEGAADPVRLTIPKGRYAPILEPRDVVPEAKPVIVEPPPVSKISWRLPAVSLMVALVIAGIAYFRHHGASAAPRVVAYRQLTRDGKPKWIVAAVRSGLFIRTGNYSSPGLAELPLGGGDLKPLPLPASGLNPLDVSADGTELLLADYYPGLLWSMKLPWAKPVRLGAASGNDGAWSPDGTRLAFCRDDEVFVADSDGMHARKIAAVPKSRRTYSPAWSSDGKRIVFSLWEKVVDAPSLWMVSADGTGLRKLTLNRNQPDDEEEGRWMPDGRFIVFEANGQIFARPAAGRDAPVQLTNSPLNLASPRPSADGKTIFAVGRTFRGALSRFDSKTRTFEPFLPGFSADQVDFSPDGKWIAYVTYPERALWRSRVDGTERLQLTDAAMSPVLPFWSPDGKSIAFTDAARGKLPRSYVISSAGGVPELLSPRSPDRLREASWFPDGIRVAVGVDAPRGDAHISILDRTTGDLTVVPGSQGMYSPVVSPDGRHLLAMRMEPISLVIYDLQTQRWDELARITGGFPRWSHNGKDVYFLRFPDNPAVVRIRLSDHQLQPVADLRDVPLTGLFGSWLGLDPSDAPLVFRNAGMEDIYALDLEER
jgi:Tol biopolymer transport system component